MYIWIILATIMVALSFFNLSPRPEKDHSVTEIKAATIVNRFKSEHLAMAKYMECEIIKQTNNSNWDGPEEERTSTTRPVEVSYDGLSATPTLAYTQFQCYLPKGYEFSSALTVKHYIYCLNGNVDVGGATDLDIGTGIDGKIVAPLAHKSCNLTSHRYLVSFAQIPDKWLSQESSRVPVPLFMSFVAKPTSGGSTYGWTDCADDTCVLRGYSSRAGHLARDDDKKQIFEYNLLPGDSILWSEAADYCKARPCVFAYMRLPGADVADYCYKLQTKEDNKCETD